MTAANHVVTGTLIASVVHIPILALPLAFLSHFVMDAIPHYGHEGVSFSSTRFKVELCIDVYIALTVLGLLLLFNPPHVWLIIFAGILAASPDLMWLPNFSNALKGLPPPEYGPIRRFHSAIQWYEKPPGLWVEVVWFVTVFVLAFGFTITG